MGQVINISPFGRTLVDDADATTARSTLLLGTAATADSTSFSPAASRGFVTVKLATAANTTPSGAQTVDGTAVTTGDYVLVKNNADATLLGVYIASTADDWARAPGFDSGLISGKVVCVASGSTNSGKSYRLTGTVTGTITVTQCVAGDAISGYVDTSTNQTSIAGTKQFTSVINLGAGTTKLGPDSTSGYIIDHTSGAGVVSIYTGNSSSPTNLLAGRFRASDGTSRIQISGHDSSIDCGSSVYLGWGTTNVFNATKDISLYRKAAGVVGAGTGGASNAGQGQIDARAANYTVATLPTAGTSTKGRMAFATDARVNGEGAGAGTGGFVYDNGTAWKICDTGQTAAA